MADHNQTTVSRCPICGANNRKREQKLVDIIFEIGMKGRAQEFRDLSREALANWIADQLKQCGFDTRPIGLSWGVLR